MVVDKLFEACVKDMAAHLSSAKLTTLISGYRQRLKHGEITFYRWCTPIGTEQIG